MSLSNYSTDGPVVGLGIDLTGPRSPAFAAALNEPSLSAACNALAPRIVAVRIIAGDVYDIFEVAIDLNTTSEEILRMAHQHIRLCKDVCLWETQAGLGRSLTC